MLEKRTKSGLGEITGSVKQRGPVHFRVWVGDTSFRKLRLNKNVPKFVHGRVILFF